jgi:flagellar hook assembly protein FlgD
MHTPRTILVMTAIALIAPGVAAAETADGDKPREVVIRKAGPGLEGPRARDVKEAPAGLADAVRDVQDGRAVRPATTAARAATSQVSAAEAPTTTPAFTSPAEGALVSGTVTVTVTSAAPAVRFTMPAVGFTTNVPVADGTATAQVPTWGEDGAQTITAADCDAAGACGPTATRSVTVDNPAPVITSPGSGTVVGTSFTSTATSGGGSVRWLIDGALVGWDDSAPYQQTLYTDGLAEGDHTLTAVVCNVAGTACAEGKPSVPVTVSVKKQLTPSVASVVPSLFSPGSDGRRDRATVTYWLETAQTVSWRVANAAGSTVVGSRSLGAKVAGTHSFEFDGRRLDGRYLPSGRYTIHVDTSKALSGSTIHGHSMRTVTIDRTKPRVSSVSASPATVYPVRDGYKDSTKLRGRLSERVASAKVQVFNRAGKRVRTIGLGRRSAGPVAATWDGRRPNGKLVPAGSYRFRYVTQDVAGNRAVGRKFALTVSDKRLVKKRGSKKVSAAGSATAVYEGDCSALASPGARGWTGSIGYYSDLYFCSYYEGDDLAATDHAVTLPRATRYGAVRVDTYGGKALDDYDDVAALLYYDGTGDLTDKGRLLKPAIGSYRGPRAGARYVGRGRQVRWIAATLNGNWYDIKNFTVRYTYYVLR